MFLPKGFKEYAQEWEAKLNAFIELNVDRGDISDLPFAVDDNIAVKDMSFTCGSKLLENVRSPYSATAVQKLEAMGGAVIGKTNIDEFGMGSTGSSAFKKTNNPWAVELTPGSGSAAAVAAGIVPYALSADAGGSLRQAAAFCGTVGLKPTNGAVSRYGLAAFASSLETIGILADTIDRCRAAFALVRGSDPLDQTCHNPPDAVRSLFRGKDGPNGPCKIGVLSPQAMDEAIAEMLEPAAAKACMAEDEVRRGFELARERLAALGHTLADITIPGLKYAAPAFYAIAAAEASANLARYDSIRYGARPPNARNPDDLFDRSREAGFGPEARLQALLGTFVLRSGIQERYYLRAHRIRAGIQAGFEALLGDSGYRQAAQVDAILMPAFPVRAFGGGFASLAQKAAGLYTCCANLAGLPALAFPASAEGTPVGVQLLGRAHAEGTLLAIAEDYERHHPFPRPPGFEPFWLDALRS